MASSCSLPHTRRLPLWVLLARSHKRCPSPLPLLPRPNCLIVISEHPCNLCNPWFNSLKRWSDYALLVLATSPPSCHALDRWNLARSALDCSDLAPPYGEEQRNCRPEIRNSLGSQSRSLLPIAALPSMSLISPAPFADFRRSRFRIRKRRHNKTVNI